MSTDFYVYETRAEPKYARECDTCGKGMNEGYLHDIGGDTLCSIKCVDITYGYVERHELMAEGYLFWTDWHDEMEVMT